MTTNLLAWWSFNNTNNDSDLLNATGDDNARSNSGHLLDNNDPFDDGFYDPAVTTAGVAPQLAGVEALFPVSDAFAGSPGALIGATDPGVGVPNAADYGAYIDVTDLTGDNFAGATGNNWGSFSGTAVNRPAGTFAGGSLAITGSANNGSFFDIKADLTGFENIDITWANRGTSTGFDSREVSVSTDGVTFTPIYTDSGALGSAWTTETADAGALLDNAANAVIRFTVDGATSSSGNNRFDNIQLVSSTGPAVITDRKIHEIQGETDLADGTPVGVAGAADESPLLGDSVRIQGIVTADFQDTGLGGFYVQEEDADADANPFTSEGIFVLATTPVAVGEQVTVEGTVAEVEGETRIEATSITVDAAAGVVAAPAATAVTFPTASVLVDGDGDFVANLEAYEGMLITVAQALSVTELFQLDRFGTIRVSADGRLEQFTQANAPDQAGFTQHLKDVAARSLIIDDGADNQNPDPIQVPGLGVDGTLDQGDVLRMGDSYTGLTGVLSYSEDQQSSSEEPEYRLHQPTGTLTPVNPRPAAPTDADIGGGSLKVVSFNVLNYFTTLDEGSNVTDTGANPRGADSAAEFARQSDKLVKAITDLDADIFGLIELENSATDSAIADLVTKLNAAGPRTFDYVATGLVGTDAITNGFLYDTATVDAVGAAAILDDASFTDPNATGSPRNRPAIAQTFEEKASGETFTAVVNHFKSKGSSGLSGDPLTDPDIDQQDGAGFWNDTRTKAAEALATWLATDPTGSGDDDILILGDLNAYAKETPVGALTAAGYSDLAGGPDAYSYVFDGQTGTLDYAMANASLAAQVSGVAKWHINADEADAFDYNLDFGTAVRQAIFDGSEPSRNSDHDPVVVGLDLQSSDLFTLQVLHASDLEGGVDAIGRAPNFAAIVEGLEARQANTLVLSAGDNYLPGPFFSAGGDRSLRDALQDFYQDLFAEPGLTNIREGGGRVDIAIMNAIGFDASAIGNHEFDLGSDTFESIIEEDVRGSTLADIRHLGAQFPYLSANLDFAGDSDLAGIFTDRILPNTDFQLDPSGALLGEDPPKIAPATIIDVNGETIGVVGATTQILQTISSPSGTVDTTGGANDMGALAAALQPVVDQLKTDGINKIVLVSHLQQFAFEQQLAQLLDGVDIVIAGGSDTVLANPDDLLRPEDQGGSFPAYPFVTTDAAGNPVVVVSTNGEYSYVGQLTVTFDTDGFLVDATGAPIASAADLDATKNGPVATTDAGVQSVYGSTDPFADPDSKGSQVKKLVDAVTDVVNTQDGTVIGETEVFIDGRRESVRTEETNMGNLTADANLAAAQDYDSSVLVSLKNGGGIRAPIGQIDGTTGDLLPPQGNDLVGKEVGEISQLDIDNALRFNNGLTLLTLTAEGLLAVVEHAFSATAPGATPGRFPQIAGMQVSFDPSAPAGDRVQSLAIVDDQGEILDIVAAGGELVGDAHREIRMVTLDFLAGGGDSYPFPALATDRVDLDTVLTDPGQFGFADPGTEQDALAEFLWDNFPADGNPGQPPAFAAAETDPEFDTRIQNLSVRDDAVLDGVTVGTDGNDRLRGTFKDDTILGLAGDDRIKGRFGDDLLVGGAGDDRVIGSFGDDTVEGGSGNDLVSGGFGDDRVLGGDGRDTVNGGFGDDTLRGGEGDDRLNGGFGKDVLIGGPGNDFLNGGFGCDTFVFDDLDGLDTVRRFSTRSDLIDVTAFGFTDQEAALATAEAFGRRNTGLDLDGNGDLEVVLLGVRVWQLDTDNFLI